MNTEKRLAKKAKTLTTQQIECISLLVTKDLDGLTDEDIAKQVKISRQTLYNWKRKPEFNDELVKQARELNRATLSDVYSWVRKTLNNPKAKESTKLKIAELVMKGQGEFKNSEDTTTVTVNNDIKVEDVFKDLGI